MSLIVARSLPHEISNYTLFTSINRQGVLFLWPVRLPGGDGRVNDWHSSAEEAATKAITKWVRVQANMSLWAYEMFVAEAQYDEPEWPRYSFRELLRIAFSKGRFIDTLDHQVIKRLRRL